MYGELDAEETLCFSLIQNEMDSFLITIADPDDDTKKIDLIVFPDKSKKIKVNIVNNSPYIQYKSNFVARIHSIDKDSKYLDTDTLDRLSNSVSSYLKNLITDYLYKTSLVFKSDINGFGKYALHNFLTIQEFQNFNWKESYADSVFKVDIDTNVESSILITET